MVEEAMEVEVEDVVTADVINRARDQIVLEQHLQVVSTKQKVSTQNVKLEKDHPETSIANAIALEALVDEVDTEEAGDTMDVEDHHHLVAQEAQEAST
jgi:hypothetical protein